MSRAIEPSHEGEQLGDIVQDFDEIDKLTELAIAATDIKK